MRISASSPSASVYDPVGLAYRHRAANKGLLPATIPCAEPEGYMPSSYSTRSIRRFFIASRQTPTSRKYSSPRYPPSTSKPMRGWITSPSTPFLWKSSIWQTSSASSILSFQNQNGMGEKLVPGFLNISHKISNIISLSLWMRRVPRALASIALLSVSSDAKNAPAAAFPYRK